MKWRPGLDQPSIVDCLLRCFLLEKALSVFAESGRKMLRSSSEQADIAAYCYKVKSEAQEAIYVFNVCRERAC
jgi:hypothetical protein